MTNTADTPALESEPTTGTLLAVSYCFHGCWMLAGIWNTTLDTMMVVADWSRFVCGHEAEVVKNGSKLVDQGAAGELYLLAGNDMVHIHRITAQQAAEWFTCYPAGKLKLLAS